MPKCAKTIVPQPPVRPKTRGSAHEVAGTATPISTEGGSIQKETGLPSRRKSRSHPYLRIKSPMTHSAHFARRLDSDMNVERDRVRHDLALHWRW